MGWRARHGLEPVTGLGVLRGCWGPSFASVSASPAATPRAAQARPAGARHSEGPKDAHDGRTRAERARVAGHRTRMAFTLLVIDETSDLICNQVLLLVLLDFAHP